MFNTNNKGYGFGPMPGFNKARKGTLAKGNWDRDPKPNRTDCQPFNFRKQDAMSDAKKDAEQWLNNETAGGMFDDADARVAVEEDLWANYPDEAMARQARAAERNKVTDAAIARARKRQKK